MQGEGWAGRGQSAKTLVRSGAVLFGAGGLLATAFLLVPHGPIRDEGMALFDALAAVVVGALLLALSTRIRPWMVQVLMVLGSVQVAIGIQFLGRGPAAVTAGGFYVWMAIFAFHFFPTRVAWAHLTAMAVCLGASLWALHEPAGPGIWLIQMGTAGVAGVVVGRLSGQLRAAAAVDGLTGLPNRWSWQEAMEREMVRARRTGEPLCVASIDLDGFKELNDERGHQAGDLHLRQLAAAWSGALRGNDLLARYGGDEFAVLLPSATHDEAVAVVERMRAVATGPGFCSGVAQWDGREQSETLLARADRAVYRAKANGRNTTVVASEHP